MASGNWDLDQRLGTYPPDTLAQGAAALNVQGKLRTVTEHMTEIEKTLYGLGADLKGVNPAPDPEADGVDALSSSLMIRARRIEEMVHRLQERIGRL